MTDTLQNLKAYNFHGISLTLKGDQAMGLCPFCGKSDHFFVKVATGQYNCRRCTEEGNVYGFLDQLWRHSFKQRDKHGGHYQALADERGIPVSELQEWGLAISLVDGAWILPQFNSKGKLANLSRIVKVKTDKGMKWQVLGSPGCKMHPFGTNRLLKGQEILWVCEGPWDGMALAYALKTVRLTDGGWVNHTGDSIAGKKMGVIAVPGAGTFNADWVTYFANRHVKLCFDNDHPQDSPSGKKVQPGWDGTKRTVKIIRDNTPQPLSLNVLMWGKGGYDGEIADGYDIRDIFRDLSAVDALTYISSKLENMPVHSGVNASSSTGDTPLIEPIECDHFSDLCKHWAGSEQEQKHFYFSHALKSSLAICLATVISTSLKGEQLFFRLIGPPASGKTTIAEALSACREHCFPKSILTGFHSGFTGGRGGAKTEASLIPEMNGKCVIVKDADTLIHSNCRDRILYELRDLYDGSTRGHWRNKKKQDFEDLRTTFILCGTDALRSLNRSFLGERFLDCDIVGDSDTSQYVATAIRSAFSDITESLSSTPEGNNEAKGHHSTHLKQVTYGFIMSRCHAIAERRVDIPTYTTQQEQQLEAMAHLLCYARARVERDGDEICYRPRVELANRVAKQFVKLAVCLCLVLEKKSIDREIMQLVSKVMHDTAHGFGFEIIQYLYDHREGKSSLSLSSNLDIAESTIRRNTKDMLELGIITRNEESNRSGVGGRNVHLWVLTDEVRRLMKISQLNSFIPLQRKS